MRISVFVLLVFAFLEISCQEGPEQKGPDPWKKIEFDLTVLDADGLRGPPDGKVAVSYEFCIPDTPECKAEVKAIDKRVEFMPGSTGRIGAGKGQCLCISSTLQRDYRNILKRLAALPYVKRIIECLFEK
ncbi:MAG: hypothetical protein ACYTHN_14770 [Planctomycetota bacterium]|jgi:hypothetical protein